jgi:hypothetical protein
MGQVLAGFTTAEGNYVWLALVAAPSLARGVKG